MATKTMDLKGLKCPQPTLKMTVAINTLAKGDVLEVIADCATFADDLKGWAQRTKKTVLWVKDDPGGGKRCQVQI